MLFGRGIWIARLFAVLHMINATVSFGLVMSFFQAKPAMMHVFEQTQQVHTIFYCVCVALSMVMLVVLSLTYNGMTAGKRGVQSFLVYNRLVAMAVILLCVCATLSTLQHTLKPYAGPLMANLLPLTLGKLLLLLYRIMAWGAGISLSDSARRLTTVLTFVVQSYISLSTRKMILASAGNSLVTIFSSCLAIKLVEILAHACMSSLCVLRIGMLARGHATNGQQSLHTRTLDGILQTTHEISEMLHMQYGHVCIDHFVEIFVCVLLALSEWCAPMWSQHRVWASVAGWNSKGGFVAASFGIQMSIELACDSLVVCVLNRRSHVDHASTLRAVFGRRSLVMFLFLCFVTKSWCVQFVCMNTFANVHLFK